METSDIRSRILALVLRTSHGVLGGHEEPLNFDPAPIQSKGMPARGLFGVVSGPGFRENGGG